MDEVKLEGHYGPYGPHCMYMGHFDAGECWICAVKRKIKEREKEKELREDQNNG